MEKEKIIALFESIGLSENESKVYFALLGSGPSNVQKISRASGVKRTTIYQILESLKEQGLVRVELPGLKQKFVAEDPAKLEAVVEAKSRALKDSIPSLRSLFVSDASASSVKYYQGLRAIRGLYDSLLDGIHRGEYYLAIFDVDKWDSIDEAFLAKHIERRATLGVETRLLIRDSEKARWRKQYEKNFNELVKILPKDTVFDMDLVVTPQKLIMFQLNEPYVAFVIENTSAITMQKQLFDIIWQSAGIENKKDQQ